MSNTKSKRSLFKRFGYQAMRVSLWLLFKVIYRYEIYGRENFPKEGGAIICSNHQSHLDPMLVGSTSTRRMNFLAKKELFRVPFLGRLIRFLDAIPIDREGVSSLGGIKESMIRLRRGELVLMFPEGTRTTDGELRPILPGFCAMARRTRAPLIPVGEDGAFRAWPKGQKFPSIGPKVRIVIGQPISPEEYANISDDDLVELLQSRISDLFEQARVKKKTKSVAAP
ncbi:MAG: 1-acyl-sn-glycerol-3-phosphate acyltransferase [Pirellulaceae bacterium]|nr:1-acyl-sn-glycerol-3-phosphate acyltransferase [Pirellulaceae bacterium]